MSQNHSWFLSFFRRPVILTLRGDMAVEMQMNEVRVSQTAGVRRGVQTGSCHLQGAGLSAAGQPPPTLAPLILMPGFQAMYDLRELVAARPDSPEGLGDNHGQ